MDKITHESWILRYTYLRANPRPFLHPPTMTTSSTSGTSSSSSSRAHVVDVEMDTLVHCASYLDLHDLSNMVMTCKSFKTAASDLMWRRLFSERWPNQKLPHTYNQTSGFREAYLTRRTALQQFRFLDPGTNHIAMFGSNEYKCNHILLDKDAMIFSKGPWLRIAKNLFSRGYNVQDLKGHILDITCMRLFPLNETSLFRSKAQEDDNLLVTSSSDHTIRLWWKDRCQRCFMGHNGPVTTFADTLLGDYGGKVLASGGEDKTIRICSVSSSGKRGQQALKSTLFGHERPIVSLSVSRHKTSLLVSMSKDTNVCYSHHCDKFVMLFSEVSMDRSNRTSERVLVSC